MALAMWWERRGPKPWAFETAAESEWVRRDDYLASLIDATPPTALMWLTQDSLWPHYYTADCNPDATETPA